MTKRLKGIWYIFKRELKIIISDVDIRTIILIAPLFYSFFYAAIYMNKMEVKIPVAIIDEDRSTFSQKFIRDINSTQLIEVKEIVNDFSEAKDILIEEKVQGIILIPKDFQSSMKLMRGTTIKIFLNTQRFLHSNDINKTINEIAIKYAQNARIKIFQMKGCNINQAVEIVEPINEEIKFLFNPVLTYGDFLIPAVLIIILHQTLLMGVGESTSKEREDNQLKDIYESSNFSTAATLLGKYAFYFILYFSLSLLFYTLHFSMFKINFKGSYFLVIVLTILLLISVISSGIFISSFIKRKILALQFFAFTSYPFFFLTGFAWPSVAMLPAIKMIGAVIPLTPFIQSFIRITQMGAGLNDVMLEFYHLLFLSIIYSVGAFIRMKVLFKKSLL